MIGDGDCGDIGGMKIGRDNRSTCPSATFYTINPTLPDLDSNWGRRIGKAATNRLSYDTALLRN
jgi:hypothetical protein